MYTYRIYFFGLICHLGADDKTKQQALIVRDLEHIPVLALAEDDFYPLRKAQSVMFKFNSTPVRSDAQTDGAFRHYVPSLKSLLGGALKNELKDSAILVDYPPSEDDGHEVPGKLSVGELYEKQGVHRRANTVLRAKDCVARLVELTISSQYDKLEIFTIDSRNVETRLGEVLPDGCALIGNISDDASSIILATALSKKDSKTAVASKKSPPATHQGHGHAGAANITTLVHVNGEHVNKYGSILENDQANITLDELQDCPNVNNYTPHCDWVDSFIEILIAVDVRTASHLECGNTNWP